MKRIYSLVLCLMAVVGAMAQNVDDLDKIIFDLPDGGEEVLYNETYSGLSYWGDWYGFYFYNNSKKVNKMFWYENGEVYILGPVAVQGSNTYIKGQLVDGKVKVELPQVVGSYMDQETGEWLPVYVNKLEIVEAEKDGEMGKFYMVVEPEDNVVYYELDEAGNLALDLGNDPEADYTTTYTTAMDENPHPYALGLTYSNEAHAFQTWSGNADVAQYWEKIDNGDPVCPPATAAIDYWAFETRGKQSLMKVAIDGNDIYMDGFTSYINGYWFKGTIEDDKIIIKDKQYMGMNQYNQFYYFHTAKMIYPEDPNGWISYEAVDEMVLTKDPETGVYSCPDHAFVVGGNKDDVSSYSAIAEQPLLWQQNPEDYKAAPNNPTLTNFTAFDPATGKGAMTWNIPNDNVNGVLVPTDDLYYNLYIDGELFTFEPDEYPLFDEAVEYVPYNASNYFDIYVYNTTHTIYYHISDIETMGLQLIYVDADGNEYKSDLVTYSYDPETGVTTSIQAAEETSTVVSTRYYNLNGQEVLNPAGGVFVKSMMMSNGEVRNVKVLKR